MFESIPWVVNTLFLVILIRVLHRYFTFYWPLSKLPGPKGHLITGNFMQMFSEPDKLFINLRTLCKQYYPIFVMKSFHIVVVSLLKPEDVEIILSSTKHLSKSRVYNFLKQWLGTGLLTSGGAKWQIRRRILTPAFHFSILQEFISVFNEETEKFVKKIEQLEDKTAVNVIPYVTNFTLQSITETAMGSTSLDEGSRNEYRKAIHKMGQILFKRLAKPWLIVQSMYNLTKNGKEEKKIVDILHKYSGYVISEREKTFDPNVVENFKNAKSIKTRVYKKKRLAMLDLLLSAKITDNIIDNDGIREEVDTFMFEGHDTTASSISLTLMLLASHRNIQDKIFEEIKQILGDSDRAPTYNDLQDMKYLERCIKESLRVYPSVPFISRFCGEEFTTTTGHKIPKDTIIHIHIFDIHRNPDIFPDPEKFDPDRFLPENCKGRHPFAYIPFSAGPRNCIGQRFAMLEIKSVLCGILRKFILEPVDKQKDIEFLSDLILRTKNEIRVNFVQR